MGNELLDAALHYSQDAGLYVFPAHEKELPPYLDTKSGTWKPIASKTPKTTNGYKDATLDKEQIKKWWSGAWKESCIGIATGLSKKAVIDIDYKNGGVENFHKLGINTDGCWCGFSANKGLHFYYDDPDGICPTKSNKKLGVDTRGVGGYIIVAPSYIYDEDGNKKYYRMFDDIMTTPKEFTPLILEQLGYVKKEKSFRGKIADNRTNDEKVKDVLWAIEHLPEDFIDNYDQWAATGMSLFELGDIGFQIWSEYTDKYFEKKPNSKRKGTLERHWESFSKDRDDRLTVDYLMYWAKKGLKNE